MPKARPIRDRFLEKITENTAGCWLCTGCGRPVEFIETYGHAPGCQWCEDCTEAPHVFPIRAA